MKAFLYFFLITFNFCQSQSKINYKINIVSLKDSIQCMNLKEKYVFEIPYMNNKNEVNFFNKTIVNDYAQYIESNNKEISRLPHESFRVAISTYNPYESNTF